MCQKFERPFLAVTAMLCLALFAGPLAIAQTPTLQEQLAAQYKLLKMGSDTGGYSVVEQGTVLEVKKGGILAVPYSDKTMLTTKYEGGTVHSPNALMVAGKKSLLGHFSTTSSQGQTTHLFAVGDKVYPSKVDVNLDKDTVSVAIVACDKCNNTDPPTANKAQVVFQFAKGILAKASAGDVEDTIGQLLSIADDQSGQAPQGGRDQQEQNQQAQSRGQGQPQQQSQPQTIQMGMTTDQVQGALGSPEKIVNLGLKQIYVYKDLKVTFLNGKVADVQ
jgi:hypothetical protein